MSNLGRGVTPVVSVRVRNSMKKLVVAAAAFFAVTGAASAGPIVFNGSFERDPGVVSQGANGTNHGRGRTFENLPGGPGSSWGIWTNTRHNPSDLGWRTSRNGLELQTGRTLGLDPYDGEYYAELDTLRNTSIWQDVFLEAGDYRLSFAYAPRTNRRNTNAIAFRLGDLVRERVVGPSEEFPRQQWSLVNATFTVAEAGEYRLRFAARGRSDSYGGLIDDVNISAVPLPAGALLLASGLFGLGIARRRKVAVA